MSKILVTGGAGFIGCNFVRLIRRERPEWQVTILDKLTYAGRIENVPEGDRVSFVRGDICDPAAVEASFDGCDMVFNFAAESHVDRSLMAGESGALAFVKTDVLGVSVLLEAAKRFGVSRFVQVSTDEVYGDVPVGSSREDDALRPRSPYAASKAGGELMARSYFDSHNLPVIVTRGSNTFGPRQYPEKLMSLFITNAIRNMPLPLYGDGQQRRDWLFVEDHARGILLAAEKGEPGLAYNVGGGNERTNAEITARILQRLGKPDSLIRHVADRAGHDRRYCVSSERLMSLGWKPQTSFESGLDATIDWYRDNEAWWSAIRDDPEYRSYYTANYKRRLATDEHG